MTQPEILEGQWEDILAMNGPQLAGRKVRILIEPKDVQTDTRSSGPLNPPNEQALTMLCDLVVLQRGMKATDGSQTDQLLREARAGGMYGLKPDR